MTDSRFDAEPVLDGLMDFQRSTVEHVFGALHDEGGPGRFLVADETGLGKSIVARGLVAKTIEHLQDDDAVDRIDIVYVCSNMDLARQNIGRLNVTSEEEVAFSSRLSLLGKHSARLNRRDGRSTVNGRLINLISFTPSTSFDPGFAFGKAEERALLILVLEQVLPLTAEEVDWATRMLKGSVSSDDSMRGYVRRMREELVDGIDQDVIGQFAELGTVPSTGGRPSLDVFADLLRQAMSAGELTPELRSRIWPAVGHLRRDLAKAGIRTVQPDLIILDEFQRFRALLDPGNDAGELANALFSERSAKVVLLSATPYKPFTYAEEDEDHAADFINTIRFLHGESSDRSPQTDAVAAALADYRRDVTTGADAQDSARAASGLLLKVMARNERPLIEERSMLEEHVHPADEVTASDLAGYVQLKALASQLDSRTNLVPVEYWKSAPYFLTFSDGYRLRQRIKDRGSNLDPSLKSAITAARHITRKQVERLDPIDLGNARLRRLATDYLDSGVWRLLWMPPSLPYVEPSGVYAGHDTAQLTKRLVFSSWAATPASVASLLSYEVQRRMVGSRVDTSESLRGRLLDYKAARTPTGRPQSMSTLMLFWPMPGLAELTDPRKHVRSHGTTTSSALLSGAEGEIARRFGGASHLHDPEGDDAHRAWHAALSHPTSWPHRASNRRIVRAMSPTKKTEMIEHQRAEKDEGRVSDLLLQHVEYARSLEDAPALNEDDVRILAELGAYSPANIAWRVLDRLTTEDDDVSADGKVLAASALASGLRALFNTPHATTIVRLAHEFARADGSGEVSTDTESHPYWRQVLGYCAQGNLEATLEEWLYNRRNESVQAWTDEAILGFARDEAAAMSLRTSTLTAFDASTYDSDDPTVRFPMRFAVRYGARTTQGGDDARLPEVRASFNSPFWPFVVVSTSVGQEGIDFHWWCHAILHWNIPANPVDFEQREGRIDRFRGHAIRKNVAARHGQAALRSDESSPWRSLYAVATDLRDSHGHYTPDWVYPGPAKIQRHVAPFALSSDAAVYAKVTRDVALYRLALGQPRQEDMLALLQRQSEDAPAPARINLAPPSTREGHTTILGTGGRRNDK